MFNEFLTGKREKKLMFLKCRYKKNTSTPDILHGIMVDQEIASDFSSASRCYGNTEISNEEKELLSLPPKYAVYEKIDQVDCIAEIEKGLTKLRWNQRNVERSNEKQDDNLFVNGFGNSINFSFMKPTDLPFNKRVYLPKFGPQDMERKMQGLKVQLEVITENYINQCNNSFTNLNNRQKRGMKVLMERCEQGELVIYETDKSGRFSVDTPANYKQVCAEHVVHDKEVDENKYKEYE